jgi:hypothetical protein
MSVMPNDHDFCTLVVGAYLVAGPGYTDPRRHLPPPLDLGDLPLPCDPRAPEGIMSGYQEYRPLPATTQAIAGNSVARVGE